MAAPTNAEQARISAFEHSPSRSSAVANKNNNLPNAVRHRDIKAPSTRGDINVRRNDYYLTIPPNAENIPNPQAGDRAFVFFVDDAATVNPYSYAEYHYTTGQITVGGTLAWRRVQYAA